MEYYKKYRIIENANLAKNINQIIYFFHHLPLIGKYTGEKYRAYGLKKLVYALGPIFSVLGQILKSIFAYFMALAFAGFILWLIKTPLQFEGLRTNQFVDLSLSNLSFLAFYLSAAINSNSIAGNKVDMRNLNNQYRLAPKESGLIKGVFDPLRIGFGRAFAFAIFLGLKNGFLLSFILAFVRIISNTFTLIISKRQKEIYADKWWVNILSFIILFAILMNVKTYNTLILMVIFVISLIGSIFAMKYLLKLDDYGKVLEDAKAAEADISIDFDQIANDSLALKDTDIDSGKKENGSGYELLNNLFFARHKRLLAKPILKKAGIIFAIAALALVFTKYKLGESNFAMGNILLLVQSIFVSILFNNPNSSRAMFLNCDRSLLQYGFYKEENAIFAMFKLRYKSLLKINLIGLLAGFLVNIIAFLLFPALGIKNLIVCEIFVLASFLFYIAFELFIYYIFQPFNFEAVNVGHGYKLFYNILNYANVIFIPLIIGKTSKGQLTLIIVSAIMLILIIVFHLLVKIYGKNTFRIRK